MGTPTIIAILPVIAVIVGACGLTLIGSHVYDDWRHRPRAYRPPEGMTVVDCADWERAEALLERNDLPQLESLARTFGRLDESLARTFRDEIERCQVERDNAEHSAAHSASLAEQATSERDRAVASLKVAETILNETDGVLKEIRAVLGAPEGADIVKWARETTGPYSGVLRSL